MKSRTAKISSCLQLRTVFVLKFNFCFYCICMVEKCHSEISLNFQIQNIQYLQSPEDFVLGRVDQNLHIFCVICVQEI